jgi:hypothetical protein
MNPAEIEAAKRASARARRELDSTMVALQQRLHPKSLATEAWDGVKEKSGDLAESALGAVRERPAAVGLAVGAVALFLARDPLRRAVGRLLSKNGEAEDDDVVTVRIDTDSENYNPAAPLVDAPLKRGARR